MWVLFSFVFPAIGMAGAVGAKLSGVRLGWRTVGAFVAWLAVVSWVHHWFITAIWAII